jgi:hypothetical protein
LYGNGEALRSVAHDGIVADDTAHAHIDAADEVRGIIAPQGPIMQISAKDGGGEDDGQRKRNEHELATAAKKRRRRGHGREREDERPRAIAEQRVGDGPGDPCGRGPGKRHDREIRGEVGEPRRMRLCAIVPGTAAAAS